MRNDSLRASAISDWQLHYSKIISPGLPIRHKLTVFLFYIGHVVAIDQHAAVETATILIPLQYVFFASSPYVN